MPGAGASPAPPPVVPAVLMGTVAAAAEVARFFGRPSRGTSSATATRSAIAGPPNGPIAASSCIMRIFVRRRGDRLVPDRVRDGGAHPDPGAGQQLSRRCAAQAAGCGCARHSGDDVKIGYAADWSEYFGYNPGNGDRFFHLDPLWADEDIDFIGIDNYMPLSDSRRGDDHLDATGVVSNTRSTCAPTSPGARVTTGITPASRTRWSRSARPSTTAPMTSIGSGATRTFATGGHVTTMSGLGRHSPGAGDGLGARIKAGLVHRDGLCGAGQGHEPAQQVP